MTSLCGSECHQYGVSVWFRMLLLADFEYHHSVVLKVISLESLCGYEYHQCVVLNVISSWF